MFHSESESHDQIQSPFALPPRNQELLRFILLGDYAAVRDMIQTLAVKQVADPQRWTPLTPTGREGEYITVHTKRTAPKES